MPFVWDAQTTSVTLLGYPAAGAGHGITNAELRSVSLESYRTTSVFMTKRAHNRIPALSHAEPHVSQDGGDDGSAGDGDGSSLKKARSFMATLVRATDYIISALSLIGVGVRYLQIQEDTM